MMSTIQVLQGKKGTKIVTASLLKQYVKANCKVMHYDDSQKLCDLVLHLVWSSKTDLDTKEVLAESIKLVIIKSPSK